MHPRVRIFHGKGIRNVRVVIVAGTISVTRAPREVFEAFVEARGKDE